MRNRARSSLRAAIVTLVAGLLLPVGAQAQEQPLLESPRPKPAAMVFDAMILRPFWLITLAVGVTAFVPAALLTAPSGSDSLRAAYELFVTEPAHNVFQRPLGDF